jgi:phage portal protein BeeE
LVFRVVPPWLVNVEMRGGVRVYNIGSMDVTGEILHIRYKSTTDGARGVGPLASAGARMITAGVLAKYVRDVAVTGGITTQTLETEMDISREDAINMRNQWVVSRQQDPSAPPVLSAGYKLVDHQVMSPRDMTMLEVSQFNEARIAELLGVPAPLVGLPNADSLTYSNITSLFDFHDRSSIKPKATSVMSALSYWVLPRGQCVELNRDEYTREPFSVRAEAGVKLVGAGMLSADEWRAAERLPARDFTPPAPQVDGAEAAVALTGGDPT